MNSDHEMSEGSCRALKEWEILSGLGTKGRAFSPKGGPQHGTPLELNHQLVRLDSTGPRQEGTRTKWRPTTPMFWEHRETP